MPSAGWNIRDTNRVTRKINTKDLVQKIEKLTKERMSQGDVVDMNDIRRLRDKKVQSTILIIEDDETIRAALRRVFESEGYRVLAAADGTQLSEVLDDAPVDLIMLDIGLPWINGFELAEMMKAHDDLKDIPLVFLSARTSDQDVKRGFEVGADDYIKKPFDIEKVKRTVNTLIQLAQN
jgi:two-component system, OmpR family, aerobic respiration control protein ArcA